MASKAYIGESGYYEGDRIGDDFEVPQRPSQLHEWDGEQWTINARVSLETQIADIDAQLKAIDDRLYRTRGAREMDLLVAVYFADLQGLTEAQLYAASVEYKRVKDAEQITAQALRDQREILDDQLDALS